MAKADHFYAELVKMMQEQGAKHNPTTLQLGVMLSKDKVQLGDIVLERDDLYIASHLVNPYERKVRISGSSINTITFTDELKAGDIVAIQRLHNSDMFVILAKVVEA
jgi:hypothetical protein